MKTYYRSPEIELSVVEKLPERHTWRSHQSVDDRLILGHKTMAVYPFLTLSSVGKDVDYLNPWVEIRIIESYIFIGTHFSWQLVWNNYCSILFQDQHKNYREMPKTLANSTIFCNRDQIS